MKKIIYTFFLFTSLVANHFSLLPLNAQPVTQEWVKTYFEPPSTNTESIGICIDRNGFIYVGGLTTDPNNKFVVLKYNSAGVLQWSGRYIAVDSNRVWAYGMAIDSSGNVYITGDIGPSFGPFDIMTVKFSSLTGDTLWTRRYKAPNGWESIPGWYGPICTDKCGNIYIVGGNEGGYSLVIKYSPQGDTIWTRSNYFNVSFLNACSVDDSCNLYATGYNDAPQPVGSHSLTLKYSSNGVLRWYRSYTDSNSTNICIAVDSLGNCYSGGVIRHPSGGGGNFVVFKYDRTGNLNWLFRYVMPMYRGAQPNKITVNRAGTFAVAAGTGAFGQPTTSDYLTICLNALIGDTIWTRIYNGTGNANDEIYAMAMDKYNNVYVTGRSVGSVFDYATIKYSPSGLQQWLIRYNNGVAKDIALDSNFNVYVTGIGGIGSTTVIATIKYSQLMGIKPFSGKVPVQSILHQNYPNPFNPHTKIKFYIALDSRFRGNDNIILKIFDILGREIAVLVNEKLKPGAYEIDWNGSNNPSGVYFYSLTIGDFTETKKMVLIK